MKRIEKLVYSLWTKPSGNLLQNATNWGDPVGNLACSALSVLESSKWFKEVELITDAHGKEIMEQLDLPFTSIKQTLDEIPENQAEFWSLGKIFAFQQQNKPFVHLDLDAVLFKDLPNFIHQADVFAQNIEDNLWFDHCYQPLINQSTPLLKYFPHNWNQVKYAVCTAIFGGHNVDFIQQYCDEVLRFMLCKENQKGWDKITSKGSYCVIFEQYLVACMSEYKKIALTFFDKYCNDKVLTEYGYTHVWGAKKSIEVQNKVLHTLKIKHPKHYKLIANLFEKV